jgi:hypothetical protein
VLSLSNSVLTAMHGLSNVNCTNSKFLLYHQAPAATVASDYLIQKLIAQHSLCDERHSASCRRVCCVSLGLLFLLRLHSNKKLIYTHNSVTKLSFPTLESDSPLYSLPR